MSLLEIEGLTHSFGENVLYKNAGFELNKGEHVGIVGQNGAGKSTLIKICTEQMIPDDGRIVWQSNTTVGYLDQYAVIEHSLTMKEFLKTAFSNLYEMEKQLMQLYEKAAEGDSRSLELAARYQEQLEKQNMFYIALECLYQLPNEWEETKETNTRHFLGINSRYCSILSKYNMGIREWGVLQKMEKLKIHLSEQEIFAYCKIFESNRDFLELNQYASIRKIVNYLAKQIEKEEKGKAYKLSGDVSGISHAEMKCYQTYIRSWKDYIEWAEKLEYDLKSRYVLFPKNFKDVHDKTFREYQKQQDKIERKKQAKERRTVNQLLKKDIKLLGKQIQNQDYILKVPGNYQEIQKEGQALGHCVGSYIPHIANRECDVYFIRKKTDPDKPFFTVDWRRGKIVQCQGKGRIRYPQEMVEFVHYAEEKLRLLKGEEEKKAA